MVTLVEVTKLDDQRHLRVADVPTGPQMRTNLGLRHRIHAVASHLVLVGLAACAIVPVLWMFLASLRAPNELLSGSLVPSHLTLANYRSAAQTIAIWRLLFNTFRMAVLVTVGRLFTAILAAYAFTRWNFRGRRLILVLVVATWLIPFQVTMLPNYVLLGRFGLLNTLAGVVLPQIASSFSVLLLCQYFRSFPSELIEAARVEGQSSWGTLWRVVVPNLKFAIAALAILLFVGAWNEYYWPLLVFRNPTSSVIQIGLQAFLQDTGTNYGGLMAASGLACLPILGVYLFFHRWILSAFMRSGLR